MPEKQFTKYLVPHWFAVIIGTGGLVNILCQWQPSAISVHLLGTFLAGSADILYFTVLMLWLIRWVIYYKCVRIDLRQSVTINFFMVMTVATIILGTNIYTIWDSYLSLCVVYILTFSIWVIVILGVAFLTFYTTLQMMGTKVSSLPETMNLSWFMVPITNLTILLIGNPVLKITMNLHPSWALTILIINLVLLGIGITFFHFIIGIIFIRVAQRSLSPVSMTSFFGILLGVVGLVICTLIDIAENAQIMGLFSSTDFFYLLAVLFWGVGLWIVGVILIILIHELWERRISFSLGWWALIFSLHVYTIASQKIAANFLSPLIMNYTIFLMVMLTALWLYTFGYTVYAVVSGEY
ncbi:C4-dicarboxylate ABC transporter [Desulfosporosinus fructosivorans]|uniref:C4-dicarboxylate ABC transporter n=1 Tax=Desulfosporosinus fructosivorans TaxID=2018669 RepID=A0A4Z0R496_9FIRM|nr:C4-dicarboxylate ABC transporter [Desulfosporosinus fructosivorans]TGE37289.1 C4-dicarboxylate ABC transporter [Desulfosporosinus fructosivorans]